MPTTSVPPDVAPPRTINPQPIPTNAPPTRVVSIRWLLISIAPPNICEGSRLRNASAVGYAICSTIFIRNGVNITATTVREPNLLPSSSNELMSSGMSSIYPKYPTCIEGNML